MDKSDTERLREFIENLRYPLTINGITNVRALEYGDIALLKRILKRELAREKEEDKR